VQLVDVNVLVYAHREDTPDHDRFLSWLENWIDSDAAFGISNLVLSGFLRVVTHPRVFRRPTPIKVALEFVDSIRQRPNCVPIGPGPRHWDIFEGLCRSSAAKGNLVPDAYLAAIAIESGSEWVTTDRDYSRFDGLRWRHPFD
jgi:toxin-antitoxin system PIN domain toxin